MDGIFAGDIDRLLVTKEKKPDNPSVFTNIANWATQRFDFPLFEPLAAFPNPKNYYQAMNVDGEKMRVDWASGWTRSIGFPPNGKILLYTKATERMPFNPEEEWFSYFFLVEFDPSELEIVCSPPRFIIRANEVKLRGTNLLTYMPAEHVFSFSFAHLATEKAAMRAEAATQSSFYKELIRRGAKPDAKVQEEMKSDFERYVVTTPHFAPHPQFMLLSKQVGFESRFEFQNAVPRFLEEHIRRLSEKSKKPAEAHSPSNV